MKHRNPKQIAIDIFNGDNESKKKIEEMLGKRFEDMTQAERRLGCAVLSGVELLQDKD